MGNTNVLAICGSLRRQSRNMGLLRYAQKQGPTGMNITIADLSEVPFYNADFNQKPPAALALLQDFAHADALLLACPEYNYSLAPALKNALDWASREPDNLLLTGKPAAILGAGGGMGTSRAQYHLRQVCVALNLQVLTKPEIFSNAFSDSFNEAGDLVDMKIQGLIVEQLGALQQWMQRLRS